MNHYHKCFKLNLTINNLFTKLGGGEENMGSRSLSIAWKIMMITNAVVLIFGLAFTFVPEVIYAPGFNLYTGQDWNNFASNNSAVADLILLTAGRMFGVHILVTTILLFAVTLYGFRKGERWSWYTLLIAYSLGFIFDSIAVSIIGQMEVVIVDIIVLIVSYIALGISAKEILSKR